jgi:hypothetical protein
MRSLHKFIESLKREVFCYVKTSDGTETRRLGPAKALKQVFLVDLQALCLTAANH